MINTEILGRHFQNDTLEMDTIERTNCKICGLEIHEGIKYKKALSGNFTNYDELNNLSSDYVCKNCAITMKAPELRKNNFVADKEKLYLFKKNDLEKYLFKLEKYISGEFVVGITTSFKKHNSFRCEVNSNPKRYYIRQEDKMYLFDAKKLRPVYQMLNEAYLQFSKEEIRTGQYKFISIEQFGQEKFREYEAVFKEHRGSPQFELLIYMMNSERRNEFIKEKRKGHKDGKTKIS